MLGFFGSLASFLLNILTSVYFFAFLITLLPLAALRVWYVARKTAALGHLEYSRYFSDGGVFEGDSLTLTEELRNPTLFPLFFVKLDFYMPEGLVINGLAGRELSKLTSVFTLLPRTTVRKVHDIRGARRDHYILETASIRYRKNVFDFSSRASLYVYPSNFDPPPEAPPDLLRAGEALSAGRFIEDPFFVSGVREYAFGDPMRRINFKAAARTGAGGAYRLMSSEYDSSRSFGAMIFLDLTPYPEVCENPNDSAELLEIGLRCACYIFGEAVARGARVGFAANSSLGKARYIHAPCGSGREHIRLILECFAEITDYKRRDFSFAALLRRLAPETPGDVDLYVVAPHIDGQTAEAIGELERGRYVSIIRYQAGGGMRDENQ